jgi:hypothetical protein
MNTNSTRSGKLLVPIVTVLYVILSAAGLIFFFLWHWLTLPFALYLYAKMYHVSLPLLDRSEVNLNFKDDNAEYGVLRTKFNNLMSPTNNRIFIEVASMLVIPVMFLVMGFSFFCVDVNREALSAGADSVFGLEFCNCVYDSILGNR